MLLQIRLNSSFPRRFCHCQQKSSLTRKFSRRSIRLVTELFFSPVNSAMMREPRMERAAFCSFSTKNARKKGILFDLAKAYAGSLATSRGTYAHTGVDVLRRFEP